MISPWSRVRLGHLPGDSKRLEHARDPLGLLNAIGCAGNFDRHPDEVAGLHQTLVDQILRPVPAEHHVVAADIGVEARLRIGRVEVDDRDFRVVGLLGDLDQASRVRARRDDAVRLGGDRRTHGFLLRRHVAVVEGGLDGVAGILGPLVGAGQEIGPHRIGGRAVRYPVKGLGLRGQWQRERQKRPANCEQQFSEHAISSRSIIVAR